MRIREGQSWLKTRIRDELFRPSNFNGTFTKKQMHSVSILKASEIEHSVGKLIC